MSTVSPEIRRRNRVTFVLLVLFAAGLCALVFWSMRVHARRVEEATRTSPATTLWRQRGLRSQSSVKVGLALRASRWFGANDGGRIPYHKSDPQSTGSESQPYLLETAGRFHPCAQEERIPLKLALLRLQSRLSSAV